VFAVRLGWLPSIGRQTCSSTRRIPRTSTSLTGSSRSLGLGLGRDQAPHPAGPGARVDSRSRSSRASTRAAALDVQNEDYVRTARAKGLPPHTVDSRHIFRNAMLPSPRSSASRPAAALWCRAEPRQCSHCPGSGRGSRTRSSTATTPSSRADLFTALVFVLVNLIVDISYGIINPRIRLSLPSRTRIQSGASRRGWVEAWRRLRSNPGANHRLRLRRTLRLRRNLAPLIAARLAAGSASRAHREGVLPWSVTHQCRHRTTSGGDEFSRGSTARDPRSSSVSSRSRSRSAPGW